MFNSTRDRIVPKDIFIIISSVFFEYYLADLFLVSAVIYYYVDPVFMRLRQNAVDGAGQENSAIASSRDYAD